MFRRPLTSLIFRPTLHIRKMSSPAVLASRAVLSNIDLSNYDPEQSRLMDERCILVDEQDNALGAADKKTCMTISHVLRYENDEVNLYRSSYGEHQQGTSPSCLLGILV